MSDERWTLLLVDGDAAARGELGRLLTAGARRRTDILEAETGADGLRSCRELAGRGPLCVLLAPVLPDMDALAVLAALRGDGALPAPVIVRVDRADDPRALGLAALRAGATDWVGRSEMNPAALWSAVEKASDRFELSRGPGAARGRLGAAQATLLQVADALPHLVWIANAAGGVEFYNSRVGEYDGIRREDDGSWSWHAAVHPDDLEVTDAAWRAAVATGSPYICEQRVRTKSGAYRWHLSRAILVPDGAGALRWFGTATDIHDLKTAEAALRESEGRLGRLFETNLLGIHYRDMQGRVHGANDEFLRAIGYDREDLAAGRVDWVARTPPEYRERSERALAELRRRGMHAPIELELLRKDGARVWLLVGAALFAGDTVVAFCLDMTERKRAEAAVRSSEERFRLVGRATNEVIWDWDFETDRLYWNDAAYQQFRCTREELGSTLAGWKARIHPEECERVIEGLYAAIEGGGESWSDEYRFRRGDGSYAIFLDRGYIARDPSGRACRMIGSMLDLTERRRAEAALRESEARFRALADNMSQLAWIADERGRMFWYNQRWYEFTGTTPEEMVDEGWRKVHHPDHVERVAAKFYEHVAAGEAWEDTFPLRGKDGRYRWFLSRAIPIRDEGGAVYQWFGTNTDVTAQREAEEVLREADRRKDDFLAMLAHELRNPLAPVRNAVEILRMVGSHEPAQVRAREVIERQVTHMARLIDDLLDVSRIARGKIQLRKERCDLVQIVRQTAEDYRASLEAGGVALYLSGPRGPLWVEGDRTRLAQMIGNLLHNASKFTGRGGRVSVRVEAEAAGEAALVTVEDTGLGMEPALLARLFDPFSQADQGLARSEGGLGLGLALVKGLVELHGGAVTARSEGLGRGSVFTLELPLSAAPEEAARGSAEHPAEGLRVVVIDDNRDMAETLQLMLSMSGHRVEVAFDGPEGIATARAVRPDVVICDIGLPGGADGYAVARALRDDPALASALLIALTGYGQMDDRRRSGEAGFDAHLVKPPDLKKLEALLAAAPRRG